MGSPRSRKIAATVELSTPPDMATATAAGADSAPLSSGAKALETELAMSGLKLRPPRERDPVASLTMAPPAITS